MLTRSEARKISMTCLYQIDILKQNKVPFDIDEIIKENTEIENEFVKTIVHGVYEKKQEIDAIANQYLKEWNINRLDKTGASILRQAIYEMKYLETPPIVVINEAIELAKQYCDEDLVKMINAVLDKYMKGL